MIRALLLSLLVGPAWAHEMTPTYPTLRFSHIENVLVSSVTLINYREDAEWYEVSVLDDEMNPVEFATTDRILNLKYLDRRTIEIYVRKSDLDKVTYVCTKSRLKPNEVQSTGIQSRICSKFKE